MNHEDLNLLFRALSQILSNQDEILKLIQKSCLKSVIQLQDNMMRMNRRFTYEFTMDI